MFLSRMNEAVRFHASTGFLLAAAVTFSAQSSFATGNATGNAQRHAHEHAHAEIEAGPRAQTSLMTSTKLLPALADIELLKKAGVEILAIHEATGVGFAKLTPQQQARLSALNHENGKCGGFEALPYSSELHAMNPVLTHVFGQLSEREQINRRYEARTHHFSAMVAKPEIVKALDQVTEQNLRDTVAMMSGHTDRYHAGTQPNVSVNALKTRIEESVRGAAQQVTVELVDHKSTSQKSIRARIVGSARPNEIVVLGGHLDSINQDWFGPRKSAPGADDNASGSSNILEALRIVASQERAPERTVEFMWYAGEEGGLLGSAEIARDYKAQGKDVVGVLQLDMTLFPGDGEFVLGSMTDFTSSWLRSYFVNLNSLYIKAKIVDDKCGYGCSDHASWNRQGYPALMPFEASFDGMNSNIHTTRDVVDSRSSFRHSAMFAKIAVAFAMDLGNSTEREPK